MSTKVFRIVVDSYPTEDGKPFTDQPVEFWTDLVDRYEAGEEAESFPSWVPALHPWTWLDGYATEHAYTIVDDDRPVINVPNLNRRHFFSQSSARERVRQFLAWGCVARVETAEIGDWK